MNPENLQGPIEDLPSKAETLSRLADSGNVRASASTVDFSDKNQTRSEWTPEYPGGGTIHRLIIHQMQSRS